MKLHFLQVVFAVTQNHNSAYMWSKKGVLCQRVFNMNGWSVKYHADQPLCKAESFVVNDNDTLFLHSQLIY